MLAAYQGNTSCHVTQQQSGTKKYTRTVTVTVAEACLGVVVPANTTDAMLVTDPGTVPSAEKRTVREVPFVSVGQKQLSTDFGWELRVAVRVHPAAERAGADKIASVSVSKIA